MKHSYDPVDSEKTKGSQPSYQFYGVNNHNIKFLDDGGIEPTTYRMRSDRSTPELDALDTMRGISKYIYQSCIVLVVGMGKSVDCCRI